MWLNILLNYILIFGHLGVPALGVKGAAVATLTARVLECIAMHLCIYLRKEHPLKATFEQLFSYSKTLFANVMKTAIPVIITEGLWAVSVSAICSLRKNKRLGSCRIADSRYGHRLFPDGILRAGQCGSGSYRRGSGTGQKEHCF